ncbi:MAG: hypothetical protein AB7F59_04660 [Bdellovibrionales bacterium]
MKKTSYFFAIFCFAISSVAHTQQTQSVEMQVANELLEAFGEGCSNNGAFSTTTQQHGTTIVRVLETIKDAPECSTLPYAVAALNNAQGNLNAILQVSQEERDLLASREQEKAMLLALAAAKEDHTTTADDLYLIKQELIRAKSEVARAQEYVNTYQKNRVLSLQNEAYNSLVSSTKSLFGQGAANQLCWSAQRQVLSGITAAAATIVSSAVSSSISLPLSAGAELVGQIMEIVRQSRINRQISKVAMGSATRAYQCTMEQLSGHWCAARDAKTISNFMLSALSNKRHNNGIFEALKVLDQELPAVVKWLERVRIASEPANVAAAKQQALTIYRDSRVNTSLVLGLGVVKQHKPLFAAKPTKEQKWFEIRNTIDDILQQTDAASYFNMQYGSIVNPIYQIYSPSIAPYILLGRASNDIPRDQNGNLIPWASFNALDPKDWGKPTVYDPNIDQLEQQFRQWMKLAAESTKGEMQQDLQSNPLLIIQEFFDIDVDDSSVASSLNEIIVYLETKMSPDQRNSVNKRYYGLTLNQLKQIKMAMDEANNVPPETCIRRNSSAGSTVCQSDIDAIGRVANIANLNLGVTEFQDAVTRLMRVNINKIIQTGILDDDLETVLVGSYDVLRELDNLRGAGGPQAVIKDANAAQSSTQDTLNAFGDTFADGMRKVLENYNSKIAQAREAGDKEANTRMKADLCFKLLALPIWPTKKIPTNLCEGVKMVSDLTGGPDMKVWKKELINEKFLERACIYHDFERDEDIFARNCARKGRGCEGGNPKLKFNKSLQ